MQQPPPTIIANAVRRVLPLILVAACDTSGETLELQRELESLDAITLTRLELRDDGPVYLERPLRVALTVDVDAPARAAKLLVGLESADEGEACVLGDEDIEQTGDGPSRHELEREFFVPPECVALRHQDDVALFVSLDPRRLDEDARPYADMDTIFALTLDKRSCAACDEGLVVLPSAD